VDLLGVMSVSTRDVRQLRCLPYLCSITCRRLHAVLALPAAHPKLNGFWGLRNTKNAARSQPGSPLFFWICGTPGSTGLDFKVVYYREIRGSRRESCYSVVSTFAIRSRDQNGISVRSKLFTRSTISKRGGMT
jgi:hypothetical protein